jgi:uncharacterized protein (DUF1778 family)
MRTKASKPKKIKSRVKADAARLLHKAGKMTDKRFTAFKKSTRQSRRLFID